MTEVVFVVTRDSCCLGDDIDSPHQQMIPMKRITQTGLFVSTLRARYPLPAVLGGKVAWACILNGEEIAVFGQKRPACVAFVQELEFEDDNTVHFKYYCHGRLEVSGVRDPSIWHRMKERIVLCIRHFLGRGI